MTKFSNLQNGQLVVISLIFVIIVMILTSALFKRTANFLHFGGFTQRNEEALNLADAGVDWAVWQLNKNGDWSGTQNLTMSTGEFSVSIQNTNNPNSKMVISTGYVPKIATYTSKQILNVNVTIQTSQIAFRYATQTGVGGVDMSQSSSINGTVYTNGNITAGSGNSQSITGDAFAVGSIASPPITIGGAKNPSASPQPLPDISTQISDAQSQAQNGGVNSCPCVISGGSTNIGPKKYVGDLTINNNATVTLSGPIWVTGNLVVSQGGTKVNLDQSFGSVGTYIIVDGNISISQGATFNPTNSTPSGYILLISNSSLSVDPCALNISQSAATAIFYAINGCAEMANAASVSSLVANKLIMTNNSSFSYNSGLASSQFSAGPGGGWIIQKGSYILK